MTRRGKWLRTMKRVERRLGMAGIAAVIGWGMVGTCSAGTELAPVAARPNIVLILADDLGWGDLRSLNPEGKIATPVLDRLAEEGIRFTDAHSDAAVCTPTRYGLMTGRYSWRSRLKRGVLGGLSPHLIEADRPTLASYLKGLGYRTGCVGKWHLGLDWEVLPGRSISTLGVELPTQVGNVDYAKPFRQGPIERGFDRFFGIAASLDMVPYTYLAQDRVTALPTATMSFPMVEGGGADRSTRVGPGAPSFDVHSVLGEFVRQAKSFIEESKDQPFFLYVPLASPHTPVAPIDPWKGKSGLSPYADFVMQTDDAIGQILHSLEQSGRAGNTWVIVASDNGFAPMAGTQEHESKGHRPSGPFRGYKADLYEGGHRIPLLMRWPGTLPKGSVCSSTVCLNDLFATVADALQSAVPSGAAEDSVSCWSLCQGKAGPSRTELVSLSSDGSLALRQANWKYLSCPGSGGWSYPRPGVDDTRGMPPIQLFNLESDVAEKQNLALVEPDRAARMRQRLKEITGNRFPQ